MLASAVHVGPSVMSMGGEHEGLYPTEWGSYIEVKGRGKWSWPCGEMVVREGR